MLVPVQYKRIMDVPDFDQLSVSSMQSNFEPPRRCRAEVKADVGWHGFPVSCFEYYGA